ncbi:hypothetical protein BC940DRAFT_296989, partial [Gongronella butleri]
MPIQVPNQLADYVYRRAAAVASLIGQYQIPDDAFSTEKKSRAVFIFLFLLHFLIHPPFFFLCFFFFIRSYD